jgi:hypothetical protein
MAYLMKKLSKSNNDDREKVKKRSYDFDKPVKNLPSLSLTDATVFESGLSGQKGKARTEMLDSQKGVPRLGIDLTSGNRIICVKMGFVLSDGEKMKKNMNARVYGIQRKGITPKPSAVAKFYHLPLNFSRV